MNSISIDQFAQDVGLRSRYEVPEGFSILQIAQRFHDRLDSVSAWIKAPKGSLQDWIEIDRKWWSALRPKRDGVLQFGYRQSNDTFKQIFSVVATVVVAVVAPVLAPVIAPIFGSAALAAATVGLTVGASLLSNALFPTASASSQIGTGVTESKNETRAFNSLESDNNVLAKESYLPVIAGLRRVSLPEIMQPRAFLDPESGLQSLHRLFALNGEHSISDIQIDGVPIAGNENFKTEIIAGAATDPTDTFIKKISWTDNISAELSSFSLNGKVLVDQDVPANSSPRWERFKTRYDSLQESINIRLSVSALIKSTDADVVTRLPIRIRMRPLGSTGEWTNLPEIHFNGNFNSTVLQEIIIRWDDNFGPADPSGDISHQFFHRVPEATAGPLASGATGDQWQAHYQFVDGTGLRDVTRISGGRNGLRISLRSDLTPKGAYEFEIIRGFATDKDNLTLTSYKMSSKVHSFFEGYSSGSQWRILQEQADFIGRLQLVFASTVADRKPCQRPGTALLAIESRGQSVKNVTALCGAKVPDWNGVDWSTVQATSNPASHYRAIATSYYRHTGTSLELVNDEVLQEFHDECSSQGYEVSVVLAGATTSAALSSIAEAGFAIPAMTPGKLGVDWFRDRSAEIPAQAFSPRNSTIRLEHSNLQRPVGIRAKFQNADTEFAEDEIDVNNPIYTSFGGYEVQEYASITKPDLVRKRAYFDMLQIHEQSRRMWIVETAIEGVVCQRGDLVGVVTDLLDDASFGARVAEVLSENEFRLDQILPVDSTKSIYDEDNVYNLTDFFEVGEQSIAFVTNPTGTTSARVISADATGTIRLAEGLGSLDYEGAHVVVGPISRCMHRCVVRQINTLDEERTQLILVDEAPQIYEQLKAKFG